MNRNGLQQYVKGALLPSVVAVALLSCGHKGELSFENYPVPRTEYRECIYTPQETTFKLWAPSAQKVRLRLYDSGSGGQLIAEQELEKSDDGLWQTTLNEELKGRFYTFSILYRDQWQEETPGLFATAVGINGHRAAVVDMKESNPAGWEQECKPPLKSAADVVLYELHYRDFSMDSLSGITHHGKYLALTESGTTVKRGDGKEAPLTSGLDHLRELGITHVHLLPSYDFASIDEASDTPRYNWGYDPLNYNVPEGSYSTDARDPLTRIREFKQMVMALHRAGIRVVMDVVYNHTNNIEGSNYQRVAPDYFFRKDKEGKYATASGCGNEIASERPMTRKYIVESVLYWAREYHIDGFRFDLMGILDIETMRQVRAALTALDPSILIYGEGWASGTPQLPADSLAMKANTAKLPGIAAFGDEMRDGVRGPWNDDAKGAFLVGEKGCETSICFGLAGAISHPQIDCTQVNYSKAAWAAEPTQMISYVSCHDDMCLADRIAFTLPKGASIEERTRLHKLALTVVLTSQGIPFIYNGDEIMRDKKGVHNSFSSPDSINTIPWNNKAKFMTTFAYLKELIALRKAHSAFRMGEADKVRQNLTFLNMKDNFIVFKLNGAAVGDSWKSIYVAFNSNRKACTQALPQGHYYIAVTNGEVVQGEKPCPATGQWVVAPQSAMIIYEL